MLDFNLTFFQILSFSQGYDLTEFRGQLLSKIFMTLQGVPILHMFSSFQAYLMCYETPKVDWNVCQNPIL